MKQGIVPVPSFCAYAVQEGGSTPQMLCPLLCGLLSSTSRKDGLKQAVESLSLDYIFPNHGLDRKILQTILDVSLKPSTSTGCR